MIRAGANGVNVEVLRRTASDSYDDHGYFGVSLFAAADLDVDDLCRSIPPIANYSVIRTSTAGALRAAGFALLPTGRRPDLSEPGVAREVQAAHDEAVRAAFALLEDLTCRVRTRPRRSGRGRGRWLRRRRLPAPQQPGWRPAPSHPCPHRPAYTASDGRWTSLDGGQLFPWSKPVGHLYEATLRAELARHLGVEWGPVRNGIAAVAAVPRHVIRAF